MPSFPRKKKCILHLYAILCTLSTELYIQGLYSFLYQVFLNRLLHANYHVDVNKSLWAWGWVWKSLKKQGADVGSQTNSTNIKSYNILGHLSNLTKLLHGGEMQKLYSERSYHNVHTTSHTSRCTQIHPHEIITIMTEPENVLLRHHGSLCTDLASIMSYTAPVSS